MDGKLIPFEQANVHILTHSLHYGGAAFEGIRAYETKSGKAAIFRCEDHFKRFFDSMRSVGYVTDYTVSDLMQATNDVIRANNLKACYIRPLAYIDHTILGLKVPPKTKARVAIAAWNWGKYLGDDAQKLGIKVMISSFRRPDISSAMTWAKLSGNYLISTMARGEATRNNCDESILLDPSGYVAEGSGENIFMVKNNVIYTPPTGFILPGLTRDCVMKIAKDQGYEVREENLTRNQIYLADEVFFTGTAVEVTPIREIDGHAIGTGQPGTVTKKLMEIFFNCVHGEVAEYKSWLTYV